MQTEVFHQIVVAGCVEIATVLERVVAFPAGDVQVFRWSISGFSCGNRHFLPSSGVTNTVSLARCRGIGTGFAKWSPRDLRLLKNRPRVNRAGGREMQP